MSLHRLNLTDVSMIKSCNLYAQWGLGLEAVKFLESECSDLTVFTALHKNRDYGRCVYDYCVERGITVVDVLEGGGWLEFAASLRPDILISVSFGLKLPPSLCSQAKYAAINYHQSLLPAFRGPDPLGNFMLSDNRLVGVSVHELVSTFDAGPVYSQISWAVSDEETLEGLNDTCKAVLPAALRVALRQILHGAKPVPQDEKRASTAPSLGLPWHLSRRELRQNKAT